MALPKYTHQAIMDILSPKKKRQRIERTTKCGTLERFGHRFIMVAITTSNSKIKGRVRGSDRFDFEVSFQEGSYSLDIDISKSSTMTLQKADTVINLWCARIESLIQARKEFYDKTGNFFPSTKAIGFSITKENIPESNMNFKTAHKMKIMDGYFIRLCKNHALFCDFHKSS